MNLEPVEGYDELPEGVQQMLAGLEVRVADLEQEATLWRAGTLIAIIMIIERGWRYWFG